jgi:dTDP-4-amino-4,6-dideoxygalactose transaminase
MPKTLKKLKLIEPQIGQEEIVGVTDVLKSGWLTEGPVTQEFEKKFAGIVNAEHSIAVCNCTLAMELALRCLNIGEGDEVIVPDFTHPATAQAVAWTGAEPVFVDVDVNSYNIDFDEVEKAITDRTKCVIPVSWGGNPLDTRLLNDLKDRYGIYIIEDAACSIGAEFNGVKTGSMADISCFSFHPRKIITTGEGGMITTDNDEWAEKMSSLKKFGEGKEDGQLVFQRMGTNYKLCNILSAIGLAQLEKLEGILKRRIELAEKYNEILSKSMEIRPPIRDNNAKHVYQTYAALVEKEGARDMILKELRGKGIEVQIGTYSLSNQPAFKHMNKVGNLNNSVRLFHNLLALPMSNSMTMDDQMTVISAIEHVLESS